MILNIWFFIAVLLEVVSILLFVKLYDIWLADILSDWLNWLISIGMFEEVLGRFK